MAIITIAEINEKLFRLETEVYHLPKSEDTAKARAIIRYLHELDKLNLPEAEEQRAESLLEILANKGYEVEDI